jgi:PAS domain S-box-containing protein
VIFRAQILLYLNPEAVRLFGFQSSDELVGRPLVELVQLEHRASFELRLGDAEAGTGAGLFETAFLRRDGSSYPVECRTSRARVDEMGAGYLFFRDITERKRLQARRENARRVDALARLSTSMGTELQSYVTELRRWIGRGKTGSIPASETTLGLQNLADSMAKRAQSFLLSHQTTLESASSTTLEELVARVCNSLEPLESVGGSAQDRNGAVPFGEPSHELLVDLEPIPYPVRGEPSSIEAGLTLLARAALKARVNDLPLCIRGARISSTDGDTRATYRLSIAGGKLRNGGSNSPHTTATFPPMAWTFGSWEQGQDLEVLGAFAMLQGQGCWVEVQPCIGGGHCFEIELSLDTGHSLGVEYEASLELPVGRPNGVPVVDEVPPDTARSRATNAYPADRATAPVLICDDEARLVALTAGLLREFGFEVLTVRSGADAIRAVATYPVDVVILDVNLPGEDAQDIVMQLRSHGGVSVILSSGYTEEDIEPELLHDDAVKAFLAKPYGVETLVDTIDQVRLQARQPSALEDGIGR